MIDVIKITLISIVVVVSFIFTLLTVETIEINGDDIRYCRPIELWCQSSSADLIVYDMKNEQYYIGYQSEVTNVTVKDGMFYDKDLDTQYKTNVSDGTYESIEGIISWIDGADYPQFTELNEKTKYIGGVE